MARDWVTTYEAAASLDTHPVAFTDPAVAGHRVVAIPAAPAVIEADGYSEHITSLDNGQITGFSLAAAGGETQVVFELLGGGLPASRSMAAWVESRDDLGAPHGTPQQASGEAIGGSFTIGTITTTVPARIYAAVMQLNPGSAWTPVWPSPLTHEAANTAAGHGNESIRLGVGMGLAADPDSYVITVTGLPAGAQVQGVAFAFADDTPLPPAENDIEAENRETGTPQGTWDVTGAGDPTIQGFPVAMNVERGQALDFKVHCAGSTWTGEVYRLGYYDGDGARLVDTITGTATAQPNGTVDGTTGMVSCANWSVTATWAVPVDAVPGVYLVRAVRDDDSAASHLGPFVVSRSDRKAPITVKLSDSTWQAYNHAGADPADPFAGANLYGTGTAGAFTFNQATRCRAISYDRPLVTREHLPQTSIWNAEYPLIRWLERCGYDVDYLASLDIDVAAGGDPTLLLGRDAVFSSGHDEYWSPGMCDAFDDARDAGIHLLYLSGNERFWRINPDAAGREYACWKDTHDGALNASGVYSGTWQDTRGFNPDRRPAALAVGQRFRLNGLSYHSPVATSAHAASPFWRDTAVAALVGPATVVFPDGIVGFEGDEPADTDPAETPATLIRLSETTFAVVDLLADDNGDTYTGDGDYTHSFTLYRDACSGAAVFGAGTVQYSWALDDVHDLHPGGSLLDADLQQALSNLVADLGQTPTVASLPAGLTMPVAVSLDTYAFPPAECVESPAESPAESPGESPSESPAESPGESPAESPGESPGEESPVSESPAENVTGTPFGPCEPWPVQWPCDPDCTSPSGLPVGFTCQELQDAAVTVATEVLWALSGRQFGLCTVTLRPCRDECGPDAPWPGDTWPRPALIGGQWFNLTCGQCRGSCSCTALSQVRLPAPVYDITQVKVDGVVVPASGYRLYDSRTLIRTGGASWPTCNDLTLPDTAEDTWSITARYGMPVPEGGAWAVGELACEFLRAFSGEDCRLPRSVTQLVRQGVTIQYPDVGEMVRAGRTGLWLADVFISTWNPQGLPGRSRTYSVDRPQHHRPGGSGS